MSSVTDESPGGYTASFSNLDTVSAASNSSPIFSSQSYGTVDDIFSSQPASDSSKFSNGPTLPSPAEMETEEGPALREWRKQNERRLEEKEKKEKEMLQQIIEAAEEHKREFYRKRQLNIEKNKANNGEKEKLFLANSEKFHAEAEKNYWKAISELIPREVPTIEKRGKNKDEKKKPTIVVIQGPKPGKPTDLSRMRHILLKLKHNPLPHMKPPAPAEAKKNGKIDLASNASPGTSASAKIATAAATTREAVAVAGT